MTEPILEIENLNISFFVRAGEIPAVMDFSCTVMPGETMGLVGESGCGKSTVALGIMGDLGKNGRVVGGSIKFKGRDLTAITDEEYQHLRGNEIAMIYQEPMASLNPAMKVGQQLMEVPILHEAKTKAEAGDMALDILEAVKLPDPKRLFGSYPHQLSGGQQQRLCKQLFVSAIPYYSQFLVYFTIIVSPRLESLRFCIIWSRACQSMRVIARTA